MEVKQAAALLNAVTKEVLGKEDLAAEDLSNIVDVGNTIFDAGAVEPYGKVLINRIGKMIIASRLWGSTAPDIMMDAWTYGSVTQKVDFDLPEADDLEDYQLVDGASYDDNVFHQPHYHQQFFNGKDAFTIKLSFGEKQLRQSFVSAADYVRFVEGLQTAVENSATLKKDALKMRTINSMAASTVYNEFSGGTYTGGSGVRAINLLYLYNEQFNPETDLTADEALFDPDFLRFAATIIKLTLGRLQKPSTLFNLAGAEKVTPKENLHVVMLDTFESAVAAYLQSDTFHRELVDLPKHETVSFWQGSGDDYALDAVSTINVKSGDGHSVNISGVLGVAFDDWALGVKQPDHTVTSKFVAEASFFTNFWKYEGNYFNDFRENFVVFFIA